MCVIDWTALGTWVIAITAIWGLTTWRRELKGKAEFNIARNVMLIAYKLRTGVTDFRLIQDNFEYIRSMQAELHFAALEAEVMWDKDIREKCEALNHLVVHLLVQAATLKNDRVDPFLSIEERLSATRTVHRSSDPDNFMIEFEARISQIEILIRPHLPRRSKRSGKK